MLKTGGYGMLRILYPSLPEVPYYLGPIIATCAMLSIVYGALVTLVQTDFKRMVAYSSISHMGFVALGIASLNPDGIVGALFHMVAHGVIIATLFFLSGVIERLYGTRDMRQISGLLKRSPATAAALTVAAFASMGLPLLAGFWGEFHVLKGAFYNNPNWETVHVGLLDGSSYLQLMAVLACLGILITAVYMIKMLNQVLPGEPQALAFAAGEKAPVIEQPVLIPGTEPKTAEQGLAWAAVGAGSPLAESLRLREVELSGSSVAAGLAQGDGEFNESMGAEGHPVAVQRVLRSEGFVLAVLTATLFLLFLLPNNLLNSASFLAGEMYKLFLLF
jgi:NADH:ubiquinone oxidoreductase subunit 5 (subunit L)/multisubunit Na+/H+ antiporter MnhA subunit